MGSRVFLGPPSAIDLASIPGFPNDIAQVFRGSKSTPWGKVGNTQFDSADPLAIASIADPGTGKVVGSNGAGVAAAVTLPTVPRFVTGIIPAAGTTPTAGTGFTYTNSGAGVYTFTFTVAFTAVPLVLVSVDIQPGAANVEVVQLSSIATTGFIATGKLQGTGNLALPFSFLAMDVQ